MEEAKIDYSRHYRNWHANTPEHINKMKRWYTDLIKAYFPADRSARIMDIGCGMGFLLLTLEENGYANVCGIDIDASQVEACRQNKLHVTLVDDTIEHLANQTEKYDLITAFDVLEHISPETQIKFLKAVYHALAPAGEIVLTVPNANSILASRNRYIDFTHQAVFTEISLDFVLYNAGFKDILIKPLDFIRFSFSIKYFIHRPLFGFFRFIRRLQMIAELGTTWGKKVPLSFNLIGKARKL